MDQRTRSKLWSTAKGEKGESSSKRHISSQEEEGGERSYKLRRESHSLYARVEGDDAGTSSGNEYMGEGSGGGGSSGDSVSLESKLEYVGGGTDSEGEGRRRSRAKREITALTEVDVWKYLKGANLMDLPRDLENVSEVEADTGRRSRKVVARRQRRRRRKATGDSVVLRKHPLRGEKCEGVTIRGRCNIGRVVSMNEAKSALQKEVVMGTVLRPIMKYCSFTMEHNMTLVLVKCWVSHSKAFRLADKLVWFSVFDVALLTGLPATRESIEFDNDKVATDFGEMAKQRVQEEEHEELRRRKARRGSKANRVYKNFIATLVYLCETNAGDEQLELELWLKLYTWWS